VLSLSGLSYILFAENYCEACYQQAERGWVVYLGAAESTTPCSTAPSEIQPGARSSTGDDSYRDLQAAWRKSERVERCSMRGSTRSRAAVAEC